MRYIFLLTIALVFTGVSYSQPDNNNPGNKETFFMDALNFYSPDSTKTRLDVYVEVPFKSLEFKKVKGEKSYSSNFDLTVEVKDSDKTVVFSKVYKEKITTTKTDIEYLSDNSTIIIKNIYMNPGQYNVRATIYEPATQNISDKSKDITIKDFLASPVTMSDIMIVSKVTDDKDRKKITPLVSRNVSDLDTFYLFFFVYKNSEDSKIDVNYKITDSKSTSIFNGNEAIDMSNGIDIINQMLIPVPLNNLSFDKYNIEITAASTQGNASSVSSLDSKANEFPISLNNMDELISQLQYIAKEDEMDHIKNAKTDGEKQKRFIEFWKKKDPSPNTRKNEIMVEYYKRIAFANKNYSTVYDKGWKSDMGMVYIIYGTPSNVEKHPYEMDSKPYEIWDYYEYNKQFVFVDNTGFGDYRLVTPIWDSFRFNR
ncbi:MAG: GWxTD domain-containing protein [Ignavibacteriae bacterium]|nr:MAG: GWxTD domain-containing protein [Ignavibacteriota bacterium]